MNATAPPPAPDAVLRLAAAAREFVAKALDFELDGTDATLPVIDHYLSQVPREKPEVAELATAAVGCYLGELLRERFGGTWELIGEAPATWRLTLADGEVTLCPMAVAWQAISRGEDDTHDDSVAIPPEHRQAVADALAGLGQVEPAVYYSLATRYDTLETIVDVLTALRAQEQEHDGGEDDG